MLIATRSIQSDWYLEASDSFVRTPQEQREPNLRDSLRFRGGAVGSRGGEGGAATTSAEEAERACGKSAGRHGWEAQQRRGGEGGAATPSAAAAEGREARRR